MKVFHGSYDIIKNLSIGRDKLDFGKGFYVTDIEEQALKWASKFKALNQKAFVNIYEFDKELASLYKYKSFSIYKKGGHRFSFSIYGFILHILNPRCSNSKQGEEKC